MIFILIISWRMPVGLLEWHMTVGIVIASHLQQTVFWAIEFFNLALATAANYQGTLHPSDTGTPTLDQELGFQFPQAHIGRCGNMSCESDHSCVVHYLVASCIYMKLHSIFSHDCIITLRKPKNRLPITGFISHPLDVQGQLIFNV